MRSNAMAFAARSLFIAWLLATVALSATAQDYPTRPVRLIVPFPPGASTNDVLGRLIAQRLSESLGQQFVVENRPGAGGTIGTELVAKAPPDGYTLLIGTNGPIAIGPHVYPKLGYDPLKDLDPVNLFAMVPYAIVVNATSKANNLQDLVAMAKASPGQLAYASSGNGSPAHLCGELLRGQSGIDIIHVPYKGSGTALGDLVGGQVDSMFDQLTSSLPFIRAGKVRILGVTSAKRSSLLPEVQTLAEQGFAGMDASTWVGIFAQAATPREIVGRLNASIQKITRSTAFRERLASLGADALEGSPEQFAQWFRDEVTKWGAIVRSSGAKAE